MVRPSVKRSKTKQGRLIAARRTESEWQDSAPKALLLLIRETIDKVIYQFVFACVRSDQTWKNSYSLEVFAKPYRATSSLCTVSFLDFFIARLSYRLSEKKRKRYMSATRPFDDPNFPDLGIRKADLEEANH